MRTITRQSIKAFEQGIPFKKANMEVKISGVSKELFLHGNLIAKKCDNNKLWVSCGGYRKSMTTKERLNGLSGVSVVQRAGVWYLNGQAWNGDMVNIATWDYLANVRSRSSSWEESVLEDTFLTETFLNRIF
tara:strand:- start:2164 stop:2559 length:396 start_codon:yes stop_codon:yes gene_type:complete